ncbi:hypothetical protein SAMN04488134_11377 [Amphibacillus marinus]|uniref:Uncharacterized protein n=1 Tax=Amphibacillus marinus TaxID=872970 RepID=A0A1H8SQ49_9BACI|nr:hypothetical protein [Amphibacillus marinus]SEO81069.1 hypothetical protein SAMN04488134_11377 [Amphibacillus marinus]
MLFSFFQFIMALLPLGLIIFLIYFAITILNLMREKNDLMRELIYELQSKRER